MKYLPLCASSDETARRRPSGENPGSLKAPSENCPIGFPEEPNQSSFAGESTVDWKTSVPVSDTVKPDTDVVRSESNSWSATELNEPLKRSRLESNGWDTR